MIGGDRASARQGVSARDRLSGLFAAPEGGSPPSCDGAGAGESPHGTPRRPSRRPRVLLVEDDEELRTLLVECLAQRGFPVVGAEDVKGALEQLGGCGFDLVVSDLSLPDGSGLAILKAVRQRDALRPKFIMMTAFGDWDTYAGALTYGASEFISKPFRIGDFLRMVESSAEALD